MSITGIWGMHYRNDGVLDIIIDGNISKGTHHYYFFLYNIFYYLQNYFYFNYLFSYLFSLNFLVYSLLWIHILWIRNHCFNQNKIKINKNILGNSNNFKIIMSRRKFLLFSTHYVKYFILNIIVDLHINLIGELCEFIEEFVMIIY